MAWKVAIGGTENAKRRWPAKIYKHLQSARRRRMQILKAHDIGIETIWIYKTISED
jgi:hypothetical protein